MHAVSYLPVTNKATLAKHHPTPIPNIAFKKNFFLNELGKSGKDEGKSGKRIIWLFPRRPQMVVGPTNFPLPRIYPLALQNP